MLIKLKFDRYKDFRSWYKNEIETIFYNFLCAVELYNVVIYFFFILWGSEEVLMKWIFQIKNILII